MTLTLTLTQTMNIRAAVSSDLEAIRGIHLSAFDDNENEIVADLATDLFTEGSSSETLMLVAEIGDILVGQVSFSPVRLKRDRRPLGYILAPLAVRPECQRSGIGSKLVENGIRQLTRQDVNLIFVYGNPDFYGRFGFVGELAQKFSPPFTLQYPEGWQAIELDGERRASGGSIECVAPLCKPELW